MLIGISHVYVDVEACAVCAYSVCIRIAHAQADVSA